MRALILPLLPGLLLSPGNALHAQDSGAPAAAPNLQQPAYRDSIAQEEIRQQTEKIRTDLQQMIAELKLNGIASSDLQVLTNLSAHLSTLSQGDMQKVIATLQAASTAVDGKKSQHALAGAYQIQENLTLKLRALASSLAARQANDHLLLQLQNLIVRQSANIRDTSALQAGGSSSDGEQHDLIRSEQAAIGGEIDLLTSSLFADENASPENAESKEARVLHDAMNTDHVADTASAATKATRKGPITDALLQETALRSSLNALVQLTVSQEDAATRLEQAQGNLESVAGAEQDLAAATKEAKLDPQTLAAKQQQIADQTQALKSLVQALSPQATAQIQAAQNAMSQSLSTPSTPQTPNAVAAQQQQALQALAQAQNSLSQQMATAQAQQNQSPLDQTAQLQKAQDEIQQAQQAPTPQAAQAALQQAQQDALALAPQAADQIAAALNQLQQPPSSAPPSSGQSSGQQPGQSPSTPNNAAANQDLAQANADLQQQKAAIAAASQSFQALAQAKQQLNQAQQAAAAASQDLQNSSPATAADAAHNLTSAESQLSQLSQSLPTNTPPSAQQAMQNAASAFTAGSIQAVQGQTQAAEQATQQGLRSLQQAQASMAQAMTQAQEQAQEQMGQMSQQSEQSQEQQGNLNPMNSGQVLPGGSNIGGSGVALGGLSHKDREAIEQYQAEKTAPEYAPLVQQYFKNLADSAKEN
jgi:hypothetical protein